MTRGLGSVQRKCLQVIAEYAAAGKSPPTFNIAANVYELKRDDDGDRWVSVDSPNWLDYRHGVLMLKV
jgi:hypothetical protein